VISHAAARKYLLLAVTSAGGSSILLTAGPVAAWQRSNLGRLLGEHAAVVVSADLLARKIDATYHPVDSNTDSPHGLNLDLPAVESDGTLDGLSQSEDLLATERKAQVARTLDAIIFHAIARLASDIHLQPLASHVLVRYRIDGVLITVQTLPRSQSEPLISRLKVMAQMDVAERRLPQDGRCTVGFRASPGTPARRIDLRIGTLPTAFGERVVIRLLAAQSGACDATIEHLHMPDGIRHRWLDRLSRASGILLTTGPTGSGKTTTLYASLRWIVQATRSELNILTIEDPIEYDLSAMIASSSAAPPISQTQVDLKKGITFASGLRHILRQDPDVIMVGEIRDSDTARTAIQASLTGHLVLSSLHTSDAPSGVARLIDLGVEPFLLSSTISGVLAQRLVRLRHAPCHGDGCDACLQTGFQGRRGIYQLLIPDDRLRHLIHQRASVESMTDAAQSAGLCTLTQAGAGLVEKGLTTSGEVLRVTAGASS
jgi:general secretion pathway protein E